MQGIVLPVICWPDEPVFVGIRLPGFRDNTPALLETGIFNVHSLTPHVKDVRFQFDPQGMNSIRTVLVRRVEGGMATPGYNRPIYISGLNRIGEIHQMTCLWPLEKQI